MKLANPEALGLSAERLTRINHLMERYIEGGTLAGIETCVVRRGQLAHRETFGYQNLETKTPLSKFDFPHLLHDQAGSSCDADDAV